MRLSWNEIRTQRQTEAAKRNLEIWLERTREEQRRQEPSGKERLCGLLELLQAANTSLRAGWRRANNRGHPDSLELTIYGRTRQRPSLRRYQPASARGRSQRVQAVATEDHGWATVELTDIGTSNQTLVRCATMEMIDAYDATVRPRASRTHQKRNWEHLLQNTALN